MVKVFGFLIAAGLMVQFWFCVIGIPLKIMGYVHEWLSIFYPALGSGVISVVFVLALTIKILMGK